MIEKIDASREAVKKTGKAFLIAGCLFAVVFFLSNSHLSGWSNWNWQQGFDSNVWKWFLGLGIVLYVAGRVAYPLMKPIHIGWMALAFALGWVNSRLLLGLFFYLIITPIGLIMRLLGKDLLDEKFDRSAKSYWVKKESRKAGFDPKDYERQF